MATDLSFLIEAADRAGARLEERLRATRPEAPAPRESKSVRRFRKLAQGARMQMSTRGKPDVEPLILTVPVAGPTAVPSSPGPVSSSGGLFLQAGITTRRRQALADVTDTRLPEAGSTAGNIKKLG